MRPCILVVEDSDADYEAIVRALRLAHHDVEPVRAITSDDALDYLANSHASEQRPAIALLDLNLPGSDGREVLSQVKSTEHLRHLPIVVFSTASSDEVIADCYRRGASGYLVKPLDYDALTKMIASLVDYWLDSVRLPPASQDP